MPTLTEITLRNLKAPERGQRTYTDDSLTGFGVRGQMDVGNDHIDTPRGHLLLDFLQQIVGEAFGRLANGWVYPLAPRTSRFRASSDNRRGSR